MKNKPIIKLKPFIIMGEYIYKLYIKHRNYTQRRINSSDKANEIQLSLSKK